jgi:diaminohydroxyphosphoribosylaminopyrimidine deaminase/5-amino-6-(5-phosphoribosylamino)uracil reductase
MSDEMYMQRCFDLAKQGIAQVSPNPMVGCVIVYRDEIIGEGYHQKFGAAHAEVNAINAVLEKYGSRAGEMLKEASVYVNLEPCAHFGKTPPCADLLVQHQVKKVIIANVDTYSAVNGKGIAKLKAAGIEVKTGVLESDGAWLNRRFFTRNNLHRPYIILKWAQTKNRFFAPLNNEQRWISGEESKKLVHCWRNEEDAILVGKNTAMIDNPQLTNRLCEGKNPIRILIDKNLDVSPTSNLFDKAAKTLVLNEIKTERIDNVQYIQLEDMHFYLPQKIAYQLFMLDIQSVIIEGGMQILSQFIAANLWDEARIFTSETAWPAGMLAPSLEGKTIHEQKLGSDTLTILIPNNK